MYHAIIITIKIHHLNLKSITEIFSFVLSASFLGRVKQFLHVDHKHVIQMLARQKGDDLATLYIDCVKKKNVEKLMKTLRENGFTEGPMPGKECSVKDGEVIRITFSGNVAPVDDYTEIVVFHQSIGTCKQELFIRSIDGPGPPNRGYLLFTSVESGKELCKLPIRLNKVRCLLLMC